MLSVVIPVFNRARQILLAVDSVFKQRGVDAEQIEIVIVDDHSTPPLDPRELAISEEERSRIKLLRIPQNSGPAAARNTAISAAGGDFIAFLDSDDVWLRDKLARQLTLLRQVTAAQPESLHAVTCGFYYRGSLADRLHGRIPASGNGVSDFAGGCWFSPGSTVLLRKDSLLRVGQFDERLRALEDLDWFIRFGKLGGLLHVVPHLDTIVLREERSKNYAEIVRACDLLADKFQNDESVAIPKNDLRSLKAYLHLELAAAQYSCSRLGSATISLAKSFGTRMRLQATLQPYWVESRNVPPEVKRTYALMVQAAIPTNKELACEILIVVYSLLLGGTEKHLSFVLPALVNRGYAVKVYNISGVGHADIVNVLENAGVRVIGPTTHFRGLRRSVFRLLASLVGLVQAYLSERPQIVHFYLPRAYILGTLLALMARTRRLIMSRRSLNSYQQNHRILAALELRLHRAMTAIVGNSQRVIDQLREEEHVPSDKLVLIYNGIPIEPFRRPFDKNGKRAELGITNETVLLITVANLIRYKGHEDLLAAIGSIKLDLPQNLVLLIVGRDDGLGNGLQEKTRDLGLSDQVRFLGERPDVVDLLRIADIGLLCSHEEGFSNALLEKMAAGLPCIATDVGGNAEAVIDEITGFLVPAKDRGAIARAILRLARDPLLRQQMGKAGYRRVCQLFQLEACVDRYEALYCSILGNEISN